ncbi:MAG: hypothetical protein CL917_18090 [Deltaproteobacteria bacterium]|nr:hypothetical protein [Deltaproteobacteria bacterium]
MASPSGPLGPCIMALRFLKRVSTSRPIPNIILNRDGGGNRFSSFPMALWLGRIFEVRHGLKVERAERAT